MSVMILIGGMLMLWPVRTPLDLRDTGEVLREAFPTPVSTPAELRSLTRRIAGPLRIVREGE